MLDLLFQTKKSSLIKKKQNSKEGDEEVEPEPCKFMPTKTCPCNTQKFFSEAKLKISS